MNALERRWLPWLAALLFCVSSLAPRSAWAELTKLACIEANSQGQKLHNKGELLAAKAAFELCAHDSCPALLRTDCRGELVTLNASIPTIVVAAKDASGADTTAVTVAIDGRLVRTALDGKPIELDPGPHELRFEHTGASAIQKSVVIQAGQKNRAIAIAFTDSECARLMVSAEAHRDLGELIEALHELGACEQAGCDDGVKALCRAQRDETMRAAPRVLLFARDGAGQSMANVRISVDGEVVAERVPAAALPLAPGTHTIVFENGARQRIQKTVVVAAGEETRLEVQFALMQKGAGAGVPSPERVPPTTVTVGDTDGPIIGTVLGAVVAIVTGLASAGTGISAVDQASDVDELCPDDVCPESAREAYDDALLMSRVSTTLLAFSGAATLTAIISGAVWSSSYAIDGATIEPVIGPGAFGLRGRF